jgi:hypothetical protein
MSNPLIEKWEEIHRKKEEPKVIKAENVETTIYDKDTGKPYKIDETLAKYLSNPTSLTSVGINTTSSVVATSNTGITKASSFKIYDKHSGNDAFLQIAEKVKNGTAQVTSVSMSVDAAGLFSYGKRITFDVYDYEP